MQKLQSTKLFTFLVTTLLSFNLLAQEALPVSSLNNIIKPIATLQPDSSFDDIKFLQETFKEKDLIALGEVTHGTKEVYMYKDRLIRYLVSSLEYKAIAFESDYSSLEDIDNYINGEIDTVSMSTNYKPLFSWLRNFNKGKDRYDKVHVYGLEIREFSGAIDKILATTKQISAVDKEVLLRVKALPFTQIPNTSLKGLKEVCSRLPKTLYSKMLMQLIENYPNFIRSGKVGFRDKAMAEIAIAIKESTANKKLIIWAHNGHVAKTALYGKPTMGEYLVKHYNDKYYVIATDINKGNVSVRKYLAKNKPVSNWQSVYYPEVNSNKAYEYYFKQCKFKNFILEVKQTIIDRDLKAFLTQEKEMRMIGALSVPVNKKLSIANNFDMVVYFDETNSI